MTISVTLSKPTGDVEKLLGRAYQKIKIRAVNAADGASYQAEMFTKTQVFHRKFSESELEDFLKANSGITFKKWLPELILKKSLCLQIKRERLLSLERN